MTTEYKGYSTFIHLENEILRSWNQAATFFNMIGDLSMADAKNYLKLLPVKHREELKKVFHRIQVNGYNDTRREVNRQLQEGVFEDDR